MGGPRNKVTPNKAKQAPFTKTGYQRNGHPTLRKPVTAAKANAPKGPQYDSGLADMFYHLGKIQQALGHNTEARGAFAEALKFNPNHEKAKPEAGK